MTCTYTIKQLSHHLDYEIRMLNGSYALNLVIDGLLIIALASAEQREVAQNTMKEDFCLHARQLVEFFTAGKPNSAHELSDKKFARADPPKFADGKLFAQKLNNQMAHLMEGRTEVYEEKLQGVDRDTILKWLAAELSKFKLAMVGKDLQVRDVDLSLIPASSATEPLGQVDQ